MKRGAKSLFIATPTYEAKVTVGYMSSVIRLRDACAGRGIQVVWSAPSGEAVARARNRLVEDFLETPCERLFFIDSDIAFRAEDALAMIATGFDVVGGVYPLKLIKGDGSLDYCVNPLPGRVRSSRGCIPVAAVGTGFLLISRVAIERMIAFFGAAVAYRDDFPATRGRVTRALFEYGIDRATGRYLSEDFMFCSRWRALGGIVWAYPCPLDHQGAYVFRGDFADRCRPVGQSNKTTNPKEKQSSCR